MWLLCREHTGFNGNFKNMQTASFQHKQILHFLLIFCQCLFFFPLKLSEKQKKKTHLIQMYIKICFFFP